MGAWLESASVEDPGEDILLPNIPDPGADLPPLSLEWAGEVGEIDAAAAERQGVKERTERAWLEGLRGR